MSLKSLNLCDCSRLVKLPENLGNLEGLEELNVSRTPIRGLFSSSICLKNLKKLSIGGCAFLLSKKHLNFPLFQRSPDPMVMLTQTLSSLSSLTNLNLSYCNLQAVPDAIGYLTSLNYLNLNGNNFVCLPKDIIRLSNLSSLYLSGCKDLRLLPELPLNIRYLEAEGCTSLETLPLRPKGVFCPALSLINCDKLFNNVNLSDMLTMLAMAIQVSPSFSLSLSLSLSREVLNILICVFQIPDYLGRRSFVIPGSEIPKWFSHQSKGTSLNLQGPSDITGIAVCVVFIIYPHPSNPVPPSDFDIATHKIYTSCYVNGTESSEFLGIGLSEQFGKIDSCHLWIRYFSLKRKRGKELSQIDANRLSQIKLEISHDGPGLVVTKCGARLVYIEDLKKNMPGSSSCSSTPYEDNLDDSAKDTKIKQSLDDFEGDRAGPSGEGTFNEVDEPQPKWIHTTP